MAIRDILQIGHPVLARPAQPVEPDTITSDTVQQWINDMVDTMRHANGAGIAANQIGIPYRLFAIEVGNNPRYPYKPPIPLTIAINPKIEFLSEETFQSNEGCLSVPQIRGSVDRHVQIRASYHDQNGEYHSQEINGYSACTWQHEYDHLDGILFPHRVTDPTTFCSWSVFQEYQQRDFAQTVKSLVDKWGA